MVRVVHVMQTFHSSKEIEKQNEETDTERRPDKDQRNVHHVHHVHHAHPGCARSARIRLRPHRFLPYEKT